jgi:hypothetical protein
MNKVIFKLASLVLCSVAAISAQQAEQQSSPQALPQQEEQQPQPQALPQQPIQPQQQVTTPASAASATAPAQLQQQQTNCPNPLAQSKIGLQARFNLNSVSYGFLSKDNGKIGMGIGFGGGVIRRTPITNSMDVNPEISFIHRKLFSEKGERLEINGKNSGKKYEYWEDETEFVMSLIPVLVQFTPFEFPLYVATGFQVDLPMLAKITTTKEYKDSDILDEEETERYGDRAWYDLGVVLAVGYNITERFSFNFRSVIGLTSVTGKRKDARTPIQYSLGVTFF